MIRNANFVTPNEYLYETVLYKTLRAFWGMFCQRTQIISMLSRGMDDSILKYSNWIKSSVKTIDPCCEILTLSAAEWFLYINKKNIQKN